MTTPTRAKSPAKPRVTKKRVISDSAQNVATPAPATNAMEAAVAEARNQIPTEVEMLGRIWKIPERIKWLKLMRLAEEGNELGAVACFLGDENWAEIEDMALTFDEMTGVVQVVNTAIAVDPGNLPSSHG